MPANIQNQTNILLSLYAVIKTMQDKVIEMSGRLLYIKGTYEQPIFNGRK